MRPLLITALGLGLMATAATANPPLRDVPAIDDALLDLGIADEIRKNCPDISARLIRAPDRRHSRRRASLANRLSSTTRMVCPNRGRAAVGAGVGEVKGSAGSMSASISS